MIYKLHKSVKNKYIKLHRHINMSHKKALHNSYSAKQHRHIHISMRHMPSATVIGPTTLTHTHQYQSHALNNSHSPSKIVGPVSKFWF